MARVREVKFSMPMAHRAVHSMLRFMLSLTFEDTGRLRLIGIDLRLKETLQENV